MSSSLIRAREIFKTAKERGMIYSEDNVHYKLLKEYKLKTSDSEK